MAWANSSGLSFAEALRRSTMQLTDEEIISQAVGKAIEKVVAALDGPSSTTTASRPVRVESAQQAITKSTSSTETIGSSRSAGSSHGFGSAIDTWVAAGFVVRKAPPKAPAAPAAPPATTVEDPVTTRAGPSLPPAPVEPDTVAGKEPTLGPLCDADEAADADLAAALEASCAAEPEESPAGDLWQCQDDWQCAICLDAITIADSAAIPTCGHTYCAACIVNWAAKSQPQRAAHARRGLAAGALDGLPPALCPHCKAPFTRLMVYRSLDGPLSDFPREEHVVLLQRAPWVRERLGERGWLDEERVHGADDAGHGDHYDDYAGAEWDDEEDDILLGRTPHRLILGNRPFGRSGYVASGRLQGRPRPPTGKKRSRKRKGAQGDAAPEQAGGAAASSSGCAAPAVCDEA
ncbi:unnamed protein product [Pedinophyceae sp. YPF-701]|nr:unnamed protein product [Pedinophyceae sp. YPF-701]